MKKVIVAHPGRQHSYRLASAIKKAGMLDCYITTIYNKNSFFDKFLSIFLSRDNKKRAAKRRNSDLMDKDVIQFCRIRGLIEALLYRVDKKRNIYRKFQCRTSDKFGKKVAKLAIKRKVDAVVMYDTNATKCFEILLKKAPHIKRIMDVSATAASYRKKIYEEEKERSGKCDLILENLYLWQYKNINRLNKEIYLAQFFIVASSFVKKGLTFCGVDKNDVKIVPYGANVSSFEEVRINVGKKLKVLFAGNVNYNKGIPYLLRAVSELNKNEIELTLVGVYNPKDYFIKEYMGKSNISFVGLVAFDKMKEFYSTSDVFVIDSFAEGMAQVGIEAMACGLPIICSTNSGVNDLVTEGENGFVIQPGDVEILKTRLQWFIDNKDKIPVMSSKALKVGRKYTWDYYEKNIEKTFNELLYNEDKMENIDRYSEVELKAIQKIELKALEVIIDVCKKENIEYFLIGGSALGCIRHGGFIPWDDDIDVGMKRDDYNKFLNIAPKKLPKGYTMQKPGKNSPYFYSKVRVDGTKFVEYSNRKLNSHQGIYVDIFPFDEVPDNEAANIKQFDTFQKQIRKFSLRQTPDISEKPIAIIKKIKSFVRVILHKFYRLTSYSKIEKQLNETATKYNGTNQRALACLNFPKRKTEYIQKIDLYPLVEKVFEGIIVKIPNNYDAYLTTHYGRYMELPSEEKRYGHRPFILDLGEEDNFELEKCNG